MQQLTNHAKQPILLVAHHQEVCVRAGTCTCVRGVPRSYRVLAGIPLRVPDAVLLCTDAIVALRRGWMTATPLGAAPPAFPTPPPVAAPRKTRRSK
jgi:hypothetical protein